MADNEMTDTDMRDDDMVDDEVVQPVPPVAVKEETNEHVLFIFDLLDDLNKRITIKSHPNDGLDYLSVTEIQTVVNEHIRMKEPRFSNHGQRISHFILYLNTEIENCTWIKTDPMLNLNRYVHGKPISRNTYYKVVDILDLKAYMEETIMCTPYAFCRDLVDITLNKIKAMDALSQLTATENLILALLKSIKRSPVNPNLETPLLSHFNQTMLVFGKDNLPHDIRRLDFEDDQKEILKYNGFRVKSIFTILVEVIKFKSNPDVHIHYPMYKLKSVRNSDLPTGYVNTMFKKFIDVIIYKCVKMCDFSIDTWLSWYEVEVAEEDTNLQSTIGHLCYELCRFIDNGSIDEPFLKEFKPVLLNIAIEQIDFTGVNMTNVDEIIKKINHASRYHLNGWIKKMIEIPDIFINHRAIKVLDESMDNIDYNCFKCIIDRCMVYYKNGGIWFQSMGIVLFKGINHLDIEDKLSILKHVVVHFPDNSIYLSSDFDEVLHYVAHNEYNESIDQKELMSKLIWLVVQQPKKMLHTLISQYVSGICGLPTKGVDSKKSCLHQVLIDLHLHMHPSYIYLEYSNWLDFKTRVPEDQKQNLRQWILLSTRKLRLMKPKIFLANVITPLLKPSSNYDHMLFLINLTKFFLTECQLMTLPEIDIWDRLLVHLARVLDDARWTMENYSPVRVELCEKVIMTIQPLLHYASYIVKPKDLDSIKQELSVLHLMTRSHFLRLWSTEYITIDGMDEQFIMTIQSQSHISYANLNRSSTQKAQEEFIFSIATYMPKFTLHEMKSFVANYLNSAKITNIVEASFFLWDCVMSALMRIIVYLKTAVQNEPYNDELCWDYLENTIINFLDAVNTSRMCSIYDEEIDIILAFSSVTKTIMVIKQMDNSRQVPLLVVVRRIIDVMSARLDEELISKLLTLIASMKTSNCKDALRSTADSLLRKLKLKKRQTPSQESSEG